MKNLIWAFCLFILQQNVYAQYEKHSDQLRILTYNVAYCKGQNGAVSGALAKENVKSIGLVLKKLDADIVAIQELDSGAVSRDKRFLLEEIKNASGIDYQVVYGNACEYNHGSIGCGMLVKKNIVISKIKKTSLPGDEKRVLLRFDSDYFTMMCTHLDLNTEKRINSASIIDNEKDYIRRPIFLAGDLNDSHRWSDGAFANFFNDTWSIISTLDYTLSNRDNHNTIDYVLYYDTNKKYQVIETKAVRDILLVDGKSINTELVSDHLPVYVDIQPIGVSGIVNQKTDEINLKRDSNSITIYSGGNSFDCSMYTLSGICVQKDCNVVTLNVNTSSFHPGIYFLEIKERNNLRKVKLLI